MKNFATLLVEDDKHKLEDICAELGTQYTLSIERSVSTAVRAVMRQEYDLIVLDMALPTFEKESTASGGTSQPQGGIEVLRALKYKNRKSNVVIVSQFPSLEMSSEYLDLLEAPEILSSRYDISVIGAVFYEFDAQEWKTKFQEFLRVHETSDN